MKEKVEFAKSIGLFILTIIIVVFFIGNIITFRNDAEFKENLMASCNKECNGDYNFGFSDRCNYGCQCKSDLRMVFLAEGWGNCNPITPSKSSYCDTDALRPEIKSQYCNP